MHGGYSIPDSSHQITARQIQGTQLTRQDYGAGVQGTGMVRGIQVQVIARGLAHQTHGGRLARGFRVRQMVRGGSTVQRIHGTHQITAPGIETHHSQGTDWHVGLRYRDRHIISCTSDWYTIFCTSDITYVMSSIQIGTPDTGIRYWHRGATRGGTGTIDGTDCGMRGID